MINAEKMSSYSCAIYNSKELLCQKDGDTITLLDLDLLHRIDIEGIEL